MSGYSQTPLIKKLGIKPDSKVLFINEPASIYKELGTLPKIEESMIDHTFYDYVHFFTPLHQVYEGQAEDELKSFFSEVKKILDKNGMVWISWPKKSSKLKTDLGENIIREIGLKAGLVDVKVAAIDDVWSGLKFVYRLKDR
jgi:hypothetical protein